MVELGFIPRVVGPQTYILSLLIPLNQIHHTEATERPQVVHQPPFPRGCLIEFSRPGKTWSRLDEHNNWGHRHVTLIRGFPKRFILGPLPTGSLLATSLEMASHLWALIPGNPCGGRRQLSG